MSKVSRIKFFKLCLARWDNSLKNNLAAARRHHLGYVYVSAWDVFDVANKTRWCDLNSDLVIIIAYLSQIKV